MILFFQVCPTSKTKLRQTGQTFFPISFKPKVAIAKFVWKLQKKNSGIMKSALDALPLFLLDDLLKRPHISEHNLEIAAMVRLAKPCRGYLQGCKGNVVTWLLNPGYWLPSPKV